MFSEKDVRNYIKENAENLINNSWHTFFDIYDNELQDDFYFEGLEFFDVVFQEKEFNGEHKIKDPFSNTYEKQYQYFYTLPLIPSIKIEKYLKFIKDIFPNHEIKYESEKAVLYISIEKEDFNFKEINEKIIDTMIKNNHETFLQIKKNNDKTIYADEYIDLQACAEYIFACNSYLIAEYKSEYFKNLNKVSDYIDKDDIKLDEDSNIDEPAHIFEIDESLKKTVDFNSQSFLNYVEKIKNVFIEKYENIFVDNWQYFDFDFRHIEYSNIPLAFDSEYIETGSFTLLYDMSSIAEDDFIPKIDISAERVSIQKQTRKILLGISLSFIPLNTVKEILESIFSNRHTNLNINKRIAVVSIPISFSDYDIITEKVKLKKSFNKHIEFIKLAYVTNLQCKSVEHPEYISDNLLLTTIAYNESRYLVSLKKDFYDRLEQFFYAISREKFVEKYDIDEGYRF